MAEHIEHLKDGIYEKVMSKEFADRLMEAIEQKKFGQNEMTQTLMKRQDIYRHTLKSLFVFA